jgi:guanylate kinase
MSLPGPLIIISGPSGSGKSTILDRLVAAADLPIHLSVSATTRPPRGGEQDGREYYFWTREQFETERAAGSFLEWAEVHGCYYGTLQREVDPYRQEGMAVILEIDVQGAAAMRRIRPEAVSIFVLASAGESYEERLRKRGTEGEEAIRRRLATAQSELAHAGEYDYQVLNDDLEAAIATIRNIVVQLLTGGTHAR